MAFPTKCEKKKPVSSCFHQPNYCTNHQLDVRCEENTIPTAANHKMIYLGVTFDRSLSYSAPNSTIEEGKYTVQLTPTTSFARVVPQNLRTSTWSSITTSSPGVRMHPIDTNGLAASCYWDNATWHPSKQTMPRTSHPSWSWMTNARTHTHHGHSSCVWSKTTAYSAPVLGTCPLLH